MLPLVVLIGDFLVKPGRLEKWSDQIEVNKPWEEQGLPHVAGVGTYRRSIDWHGTGQLLLRLPACTDAVEVRVNGESCGSRVWYPYVFDLTQKLRQGANDLEIRVHNTLGNLIPETFLSNGQTSFPVSGLLCPPELIRV